MGICSFGSSDRYDEKKTPVINVVNLPNPNPDRFEILKTIKLGHYLIVEIKYLDCTNYEGKKIMVYMFVDLKDLLNQKKIDPHFSENDGFYSPIARFEPTMRGWDMAKTFCAAMMNQQIY